MLTYPGCWQGLWFWPPLELVLEWSLLGFYQPSPNVCVSSALVAVLITPGHLPPCNASLAFYLLGWASRSHQSPFLVQHKMDWSVTLPHTVAGIYLESVLPHFPRLLGAPGWTDVVLYCSWNPIYRTPIPLPYSSVLEPTWVLLPDPFPALNHVSGKVLVRLPEAVACVPPRAASLSPKRICASPGPGLLPCGLALPCSSALPLSFLPSPSPPGLAPPQPGLSKWVGPEPNSRSFYSCGSINNICVWSQSRP